MKQVECKRNTNPQIDKRVTLKNAETSLKGFIEKVDQFSHAGTIEEHVWQFFGGDFFLWQDSLEYHQRSCEKLFTVLASKPVLAGELLKEMGPDEYDNLMNC